MARPPRHQMQPTGHANRQWVSFCYSPTPLLASEADLRAADHRWSEHGSYYSITAPHTTAPQHLIPQHHSTSYHSITAPHTTAPHTTAPQHHSTSYRSTTAPHATALHSHMAEFEEKRMRELEALYKVKSAQEVCKPLLIHLFNFF